MSELRIGDSDRERASSELGDHLAAGRLDVVEHSERLDAVWTARTQGDLDALFFDLPPLRAPSQHSPRPRQAGRPVRLGNVPLVWIAIAVVVAFVLLRSPFLLIIGVGAAAYFHLRRGRRREGPRDRQERR